MQPIIDDMSLDDLIDAALELDQIEGINEILRLVTLQMEAEGCILWAQSQSVDKKGKTLFTLAHHFNSNESYALHNIELDKSLAGKAIKENSSFFIKDVNDPGYPYYESCAPLLRDTDISSYISVPVHFKSQPNGALNIYFNDVFEEEPSEIIRLGQRIARLIPGLYCSIRERAGFHLLKEVNDIFYEAGVAAIDKQLSHKEMNAVIQRICDCVSRTFRAKDCSIILEDEYDDTPGYEIRGTTSPEWIDELGRNTYIGDVKEGLVDWALHFKQPVRIFDLKRFKEDWNLIQNDYPGINWKDGLNIVKKALKRFNKLRPSDLPPISFMAAPIVMEADGRLVGAIRCVMATKGPFYFSDDDLALLQNVAIRIGQAWRSWINRRTVGQENEVWKEVVFSLGSLNHFVRKSLKEGKLNEEEMFERVFSSIENIIPDASIMDIRFYDEKKDYLYYKHFHGKLWTHRPDGTERSKVELRALKKHVFPISGPENSLGKVSFLSGEVFVVNDVTNKFEARYYNKVFPSVKSTLVAPITSGHQDKNLGVIGIQSEVKAKFPHYAKTIFSLIGEQIGLYYRLNSIFEEQKRTYENLAHQLKTPIDQAYKRSVRALECAKRRENVESRIMQIRGLCNKAKAVTGSIRLLVDFEQGTPPSVALHPISSSAYVKMLVECAADNRLLTIPRLNLQFIVERESFDFLKHASVKIHNDLFLQALNNVLDNAGKYSYKDTSIRIEGGLMQDERLFYTSIQNKGFPITEADVCKCTERGWRGPYSHQVSAGGSGIGLWLVDLIMDAHKGKLEIIPTREDGWNEVRLILPLL